MVPFWKWTLGLAQGGEEISKIPVIIHLLSTIPSVDNELRWEEIESSFKMPYALILWERINMDSMSVEDCEILWKPFWPWLDWWEYQTNGPFFVAKSQWSWWTTLLVGGSCFPLLVKERFGQLKGGNPYEGWTCVRLHLVEPIPPPIERGSRCKILKCGPLSEDSRPPFYKIYCGIENFGPDICLWQFEGEDTLVDPIWVLDLWGVGWCA